MPPDDDDGFDAGARAAAGAAESTGGGDDPTPGGGFDDGLSADLDDPDVDGVDTAPAPEPRNREPENDPRRASRTPVDRSALDAPGSAEAAQDAAAGDPVDALRNELAELEDPPGSAEAAQDAAASGELPSRPLSRDEDAAEAAADLPVTDGVRRTQARRAVRDELRDRGRDPDNFEIEATAEGATVVGRDTTRAQSGLERATQAPVVGPGLFEPIAEATRNERVVEQTTTGGLFAETEADASPGVFNDPVGTDTAQALGLAETSDAALEESGERFFPETVPLPSPEQIRVGGADEGTVFTGDTEDPGAPVSAEGPVERVSEGAAGAAVGLVNVPEQASRLESGVEAVGGLPGAVAAEGVGETGETAVAVGRDAAFEAGARAADNPVRTAGAVGIGVAGNAALSGRLPRSRRDVRSEFDPTVGLFGRTLEARSLDRLRGRDSSETQPGGVRTFLGDDRGQVTLGGPRRDGDGDGDGDTVEIADFRGDDFDPTRGRAAERRGRISRASQGPAASERAVERLETREQVGFDEPMPSGAEVEQLAGRQPDADLRATQTPEVDLGGGSDSIFSDARRAATRPEVGAAVGGLLGQERATPSGVEERLAAVQQPTVGPQVGGLLGAAEDVATIGQQRLDADQRARADIDTLSELDTRQDFDTRQDVAGDLDRDIDRDVDRDLDRDVDRDLDRDVDRDIDRDLARDLDRDIDQPTVPELDPREDEDEDQRPGLFADPFSNPVTTPEEFLGDAFGFGGGGVDGGGRR